MKLVAHIYIEQEPAARAAEFRTVEPRVNDAILTALQDLEIDTIHGTVAIRGVSVRLEDA